MRMSVAQHTLSHKASNPPDTAEEAPQAAPFIRGVKLLAAS